MIIMFGNRSILIERPRPEAIRSYRGAAWLAVGVVCFGAFMGQLDASIVTLTFRPMQLEFDAPLAAVQWVSLIYLLTLVALLAPMGRISDARGRKLVYGYGFVAFTLAPAACALAPPPRRLVAFRLGWAGGGGGAGDAPGQQRRAGGNQRAGVGDTAGAGCAGGGAGARPGARSDPGRDPHRGRGLAIRLLGRSAGWLRRGDREPLPAATDQAVQPRRPLRLAGHGAARPGHHVHAAGAVRGRRPEHAWLGGRRPGGRG